MEKELWIQTCHVCVQACAATAVDVVWCARMPMTWERVGSSAFSSGIIYILLQLHRPTPLLSEVLQLFKVTRRRVVVVTSSSDSSCNNCNYSCIILRPFSLKRFPLHHPIASKSPYSSIIPSFLLNELLLHSCITLCVSRHICVQHSCYSWITLVHLHRIIPIFSLLTLSLTGS